MKRFFFSMMALTAVAVGCTQSALLETPDLLGTEVSFSTYTGRTPVTKAQQIAQPDTDGNMPEGAITLAVAGGFKLYGLLTKEGNTSVIGGMNNVDVTYDNGWNYGRLVYWPDASSESTMSFVAYSRNAVEKGSIKPDHNNIKEDLKFTVKEDVDDQVDFLATAYQEGCSLNTNTDGNVTLQFQHLLSRIGFKVETTTDASVTIKNLSFSGRMFSQGTLNLTLAKGSDVPELVGTAKKDQTYKFLEDASVEISGAKSSAKRVSRGGSDFLMILPHTVAQGDYHVINVEYKVGNGKFREAFVELEPGFDFKQGKAYEFILKISTSAIKFVIDETPWNDPNESATTYPIEPSPDEPVYYGVAKSISTDSAVIPVTVNHEGLEEVGVLYRKSNEPSWRGPITIDKESGEYQKKTYEVTLSRLESNTEYEYRAYSKKTAESDVVYSPVNEEEAPFFFTKASVDFGELVNTDNPDEDDVKEHTANVSGTCSDYADGNIVEWGFCWMRGKGNPTINDEVANNENASITIDDDGNFSYTITELESNTLYSCRSYVKNSAGDVSYSTTAEFTTRFVFEDEDDTGSGWN